MTSLILKKVELPGGKVTIKAIEKATKAILGYAEICPKKPGLLEIDQIWVASTARGHGIGQTLALKAFKYAIKHEHGIHMLIQPGSSVFWSKFLNRYFKCKKISFFDSSLSAHIKDGKVLDIAWTALVLNYSYPTEEPYKDRTMAKLCVKGEERASSPDFLRSAFHAA